MGREETLVSLLSRRVNEDPDRPLYTFLEDGERESARLARGELETRARAVAAALAGRIGPGARVLLLYPPGLEYIVGLFGCLLAGAVAVPVYPPDPKRLARTLPRLEAIHRDAQVGAVLTTRRIALLLPLLGLRLRDLGRLPVVASDRVAATPAGPVASPRHDELAILQYTSGSTGRPNGVMLSHANILDNLGHIARSFGLTAASSGVSWLPPYHDMGLIGGILGALYCGGHQTLFSPVDFLKRPLRWLRAVSERRAEVSGGPNFAYDLCARKATDLDVAALDLRTWAVAFNGAEAVRPETMERFARRFGPCGFAPAAFYPCYGLAETTLLAAGARRGDGPRVDTFDEAQLATGTARPAAAGRRLAASGKPIPGLALRIVDPATCRRRAEGEVGEVWVAGESVAGGYFNRPDRSAQAFAARLAGEAQRRYLRTGDLGFLAGGHLFIVGRIKDLIIVHGRNLYPDDIEPLVWGADPRLRPGSAAAFTADEPGEEALAVAVEVRSRLGQSAAKEVIRSIRAAVAERLEVRVQRVFLLAPGGVPKTTSGKVQRHACRAAVAAGGPGLEVLAVG